MKEILVDDIMNEPVYSVDVDSTVSEALQVMKDKSVKKILVTESDRPIGVLEGWKLTPRHQDAPLDRLRDEFASFGLIEAGTSLVEARDKVFRVSAVYVHPRGDPSKLIGVLTKYDVARAL